MCVCVHVCTYVLEMGGYKEAGIRFGSVTTEMELGSRWRHKETKLLLGPTHATHLVPPLIY